MEAHGEDFRAESSNTTLADHLKHDWLHAELPETDRALCEWAKKVTLTPRKAGPTDVDRLRTAGFSEEAISDAAQVIGYFNYINRIAESLGVDLEPNMPQPD